MSEKQHSHHFSLNPFHRHSHDETDKSNVAETIEPPKESQNTNTPPLSSDGEKIEPAQSAISSKLDVHPSKVPLEPEETASSLESDGLSAKVPVPDVVNPVEIEHPVFPEEYTLETETGLVPASALESIGRKLNEE